MILDSEQVLAERQRRVFLATIQMVMALGQEPNKPVATGLDLGSTIDGLLEAVAALVVEAQVLHDGPAEQQFCEDVARALLQHIRQSMRERDVTGTRVNH